MREREAQAMPRVEAPLGNRRQPAGPIQLIGYASLPLVVQQSVMRQVGKLSQSPLAQQGRAAHRVEVLPEQQIAPQPLIGSVSQAYRHVDFLARKVRQWHRGE